VSLPECLPPAGSGLDLLKGMVRESHCDLTAVLFDGQSILSAIPRYFPNRTGLPLFKTEIKFDSGTGSCSFYAPIPLKPCRVCLVYDFAGRWEIEELFIDV
jgi:hypothetical protein